MSVCTFDPQHFFDCQARHCLVLVKRNGVMWWRDEYKPRLLNSWGKDKLNAVTDRMEELRNTNG